MYALLPSPPYCPLPDIRRSVVVEFSGLFRSTTKAVKSPPIISNVNIYTGTSKIRTYLQKYPDICFLYHLEQSARVPLLSAERWYQGAHYCLIQADCTVLIHCRSLRIGMKGTNPKSLAPQANTLPDFVRIKLDLEPAAIWAASTPRRTGISNKFVQKRISLSSTFTRLSDINGVDVGRTAREELT